MHKRVANNSISFREMPDGMFFRVLSPDSEYRSQYMISVFDEELPESMRENDETSALFLLRCVIEKKGFPTEIEVREIDFDISDETLVQPLSPIDQTPNGAYVVLPRDDGDPQNQEALRIIQVGKDGAIKRRQTRRGGGSGRMYGE